MHYFLDGYNLLFHVFPEEEDLLLRREDLIEYLSQICLHLDLQITLVFDAQATPDFSRGNRGHSGVFEVVFTPEGQTADEYILDELLWRENPKHIVVVTSDRTLARKAKHCGAEAEGSAAFVRKMTKRYHKRKKKESKESTKITQSVEKSELRKEPLTDEERWLEIFEKRTEEMENGA